MDKKNNNSDKVVYILGSGFSKPAGGPNQEEILREVFQLNDNVSRIKEYKKDFKNFLVDTLNIKEEFITKFSLEDIYTPIDRCLADGVSLRGKDSKELQEIRGKMEYLISRAIEDKFQESPTANKEYVKIFAEYLVKQAAVRAKKAENGDADMVKGYDPFSIISSNWDILLDNQIYDALQRRDGHLTGSYDPFGVVDYCCYISSIEQDAQRIRPGLWSLGCKGYNIKLLKIHGSMNWLQCANCQRLFVGFGEKLNILNYINAEPCRHCAKQGCVGKLHATLVMPTFLKDLSNFQIKLIWQNAGVELMEAKRLVFIGYSLPHADFEFRQLLSRMANKNAEIEVVLYDDKTNSGSDRYKKECERYATFFSGHSSLKFEPNGVKAFVERLRESL